MGPVAEATPGPPLERHQGAERDNRPAWMTKGVGVGTELLGESTGELVKPGMTRTEFEEIEKRGVGDGPDPFGDVFKEAAEMRVSALPPPAPTSGRAPLPDQASLFPGSQPPPPPAPNFGGPAPNFGAGPPPGNPYAKQGCGYKVQLCTFFEQNKCTRGSQCTFAHGPGDLRRK